jgi:ubiquitin-conjugating enzyme E2 S
LLIVPNPESALNEEAGKMLLEHYDDYSARAKLMTDIHARPSCSSSKTEHSDDDGCSSSKKLASDKKLQLKKEKLMKEKRKILKRL